jgi:DNA-binding IclR family transcriptional regulator
MPKLANQSQKPDKNLKPSSDDSSASFLPRITRILDSLSEGVNTVNDVAKDCSLSTSTTHRLLNMLKKELWTVYDAANHHYYLGPRIARLASDTKASHQYLLISALDEMKRLSDVTQETITLNLVVGIQLVHLYEIPSKKNLRIIEGTTELKPVIPLGAGQKVLLSQLSERELKLALKAAANWDPRYKDISLTKLMDELKQIRQKGYAETHGEAIPECFGIAAPIKNYSCPTALSIIAPEKRISDRIPILVKELLASTHKISKNLLNFLEP